MAITKKPLDWAKTGGVFLFLVLLFSYLGELFFDFPIKTAQIVLIVLIVVAFFIVLRFLSFAKASNKAEFEDIFFLLIALAVVGFIFWKLPTIFPTFSAAVKNMPIANLASIIGL